MSTQRKQQFLQELQSRIKVTLDAIKSNKDLAKIIHDLPDEKRLDIIAMIFLSTNIKAGYEKQFVEAVMSLKDLVTK